MRTEEGKAANALKSIARDPRIKTYIQQSPDLYPLLYRAAKRFITGETRKDGISKAKELVSKGYSISLEYIGENTKSVKECIESKNEFLALIKEANYSDLTGVTVSLDLSHIGLTEDPGLAYDHLVELTEEAQSKDFSIMISMEESEKTDAILDIYKRASKRYSNVGITIQAHLHRSTDDIQELLDYPGKIRIVKGAYQEPSEKALPRSEALNKRYMELIDRLVKAEHPVSIATHDEAIIQEARRREILDARCVEMEMLYGIRPDRVKGLKDEGVNTKVYLTYGVEWYLYVCHRLAEYPPNIYTAIADMVEPDGADKSYY
ncbi:proline dehydrogenase family protein [Desmospora profundinema]|uniref:proline dehydrogenase n=1 Tax=Desmospora profundinema TaxID=1571184 RepID=A0ABU1II07_9BACL|nr:proline dehydrogenase family protein [Desmospora profundinema]MDR6224405.1 proline dehydrogenase [Desmospora profundinema]